MRHVLFAAFLLAGCATVREPVAVTEAPAAAPERAMLAAHRAENIERLHDYWVAGEFPRDWLQNPASVFRDAAGRECPMAALIAQSGHDDLVAQVAATDNTLRLADVHSGPLQDWILQSGFTHAEVEEIQGVMDFSGFQLIDNLNQELRVATTDHEVRVRVRNIETALRANTANSLVIAEAALRGEEAAVVADAAPIADRASIAGGPALAPEVR